MRLMMERGVNGVRGIAGAGCDVGWMLDAG